MNEHPDPKPMGGSPLRCEGIFKRYDGNAVLNDVSLSLAPGAIFGLVGRNGAGKTTLIQILLGLLQADSGSAMVMDEPALTMTDASKRRLGYVPQQPETLGWMHVGDMLDFVGDFYPMWDQPYVDDCLKRWSIAPSRPLSKLSPGERQRIALIRALAIRPELLVLDEPAAALDPVARRDLLRELALRAGESGTTVLFSTHIVSDLERVASHVACLHHHKMVLTAPMDDLKETHALLQVNSDRADQFPGQLPGELSRRRRNDGGLSIILVRDSAADWPAPAGQAGVQIESPGLEDLIIELTS
jgi:ABC-2 type transport system ATP-binding protein